MRRAATIALLTVAALPATATAARTPVCNLLRDPALDTYVVRDVAAVSDEDALDITSADVAADAATLTGVVRVRGLAAPPSSTAPSGYTYTLRFGWTGSASWETFLYATVSPARTTFGLAAYRPGLVDPASFAPEDARVTGVLDPARGEIRLSVPLADLRAYAPIGPGTTVTLTGAFTARSTGADGAAAELYGDGVYADDVERRATYVVGTPSCVRPGR